MWKVDKIGSDVGPKPHQRAVSPMGKPKRRASRVSARRSLRTRRTIASTNNTNGGTDEA
jgi:hypothetical protein